MKLPITTMNYNEVPKFKPKKGSMKLQIDQNEILYLF